MTVLDKASTPVSFEAVALNSWVPNGASKCIYSTSSSARVMHDCMLLFVRRGVPASPFSFYLEFLLHFLNTTLCNREFYSRIRSVKSKQIGRVSDRHVSTDVSCQVSGRELPRGTLEAEARRTRQNFLGCDSKLQKPSQSKRFIDNSKK